MKVKLFTRDGGFVKNLTTPPFQLMPEIIMWGQRTFVRDIFRDTTVYYGYSEAMMWSNIASEFDIGWKDEEIGHKTHVTTEEHEAACEEIVRAVSETEPGASYPYKEYGRGPTY